MKENLQKFMVKSIMNYWVQTSKIILSLSSENKNGTTLMFAGPHSPHIQDGERDATNKFPGN